MANGSGKGSPSALDGLAKAGLTEQEMDRLVIPQGTRRRHAAKGQPLTIDESDRAVRLLRIQSLAENTFGDKASQLLRWPLKELGDEAPLMIAQAEAGARVIETILAGITWGAAA